MDPRAEFRAGVAVRLSEAFCSKMLMAPRTLPGDLGSCRVRNERMRCMWNQTESRSGVVCKDQRLSAYVWGGRPDDGLGLESGEAMLD